MFKNNFSFSLYNGKASSHKNFKPVGGFPSHLFVYLYRKCGLADKITFPYGDFTLLFVRNHVSDPHFPKLGIFAHKSLIN